MPTHNLDDQVSEYFDFSVKGFVYRFRHLNTSEVEEMKTLGDDEQKTKQFLMKFIESTAEGQPPFEEIQKTMILPQWKNFQNMIKTEFGGV